MQGGGFSALGFPFEAEQVGLGLQSARIADQSAAAADHAVAGDDDGDSGYGGLKVFERVFDHLLPDIGRVVGLHRMVLVGVDHHVVLLAAAVQGTCHLHAVLEMNVVVGRAVDDEQSGLGVVEHPGEVNRGVVVVACGVVLRQVVVDFGVNRVVVAPRSDGSHGDRHAE